MIFKIKQLFQHQGFKKYFANTSWLFAEKILRMIVGFFVGVWVARYLGPDRYGLLSYAQAFVGLFSAIATLGLNGILVRELVKHPEKEDELLKTTFILRLLGAVLTLIILYIAVHFTSNDTYTNTMIFIIASAVIFQSFNVIDMYFQAKVMNKYVVFANSFSLLFSSLIKIFLIINKAQLICFAFVILFDNFVMALGYIYWYLRTKKEFFLKKIKFSFDLAKSLLKDSWPMLFGSFIYYLYYRIDQIMIKEILGNKEVGYYSIAVRLSELWFFIPMSIVMALFPAIINAKKINEQLYYDRLQKLYILMVWMSIVSIVFFEFFGNFIIINLYGSKFVDSIGVLKILVISSLFIVFSIARNKWLIIENLQKYIIYMHLSGAILNILLNLSLINCCGIKGAAIASVISYFIALIIVPLFFKKLRSSIFMFLRSFLFINILRKK